jgi:hypothetical protein
MISVDMMRLDFARLATVTAVGFSMACSSARVIDGRDAADGTPASPADAAEQADTGDGTAPGSAPADAGQQPGLDASSDGANVGQGAQVLLSGCGYPAAIAVNATNIFIECQGNGSFTIGGANGGIWSSGAELVIKCPLGGCGATPSPIYVGSTVITSGVSTPYSQFPTMAVDSTSVYWLNSLGEVTIIPLDGEPDGGKPTRTDTCTGLGTASVGSLALIANQLYVGGGDGNGCVATSSLPLEDNAPNFNVLASGYTFAPLAIAADANNLYWLNESTGTENGSYTGFLTRAPKTPPSGGLSMFAYADVDTGDGGYQLTAVYDGYQAGGMATTLASNLGEGMPGAMVIDDENAYWCDQANGLILACSLTAGCGTHPTVLASGIPTPYGIAEDDTYIYWNGASAAPGDVIVSSVRRCAKTGCNNHPDYLTNTGWSNVGPGDFIRGGFGIVVDASNIYWIAWQDAAEGEVEVMKAPK